MPLLSRKSGEDNLPARMPIESGVGHLSDIFSRGRKEMPMMAIHMKCDF